MSTLATDIPADVRPEEVDGPKLLRLRQALAALLAEVGKVDPDPDEEHWLIAAVPRMLAEVGSSLPDSLLDELGRLVGPTCGPRLTACSARLVLSQLEGWLDALAAEAFASFASGTIASTAG